MRITCQDDINQGAAFLQEADPRLQPLFEEIDEIPLRRREPDFPGLAGIIVSQQVSKASADAIFGRLQALVDPLTPEAFLEAGEEIWRAAGLSRPKQATLAAASTAICCGELNLEALSLMPAEEAIERMTEIKGIGPWTAEVYLMFCGGHRDVFPAGDLALREAIRVALDREERPSVDDCRIIAQSWSPWRAVAARLLWAYYGKIRRDALPVGASDQ